MALSGGVVIFTVHVIMRWGGGAIAEVDASPPPKNNKLQHQLGPRWLALDDSKTQSVKSGGGWGARRASVNVEQRHDSDGSETRAEGRHGRLLVDHEDSLTEHKRTTLVPDDRCQVDSNVQVAFFFSRKWRL